MARSARRRTWLGSVMTAAGKFVRARRTEASDTADAATTWWPARARAAPSAVPALPAPMMPTASLAGRSAGWLSGFIAEVHLVPVLGGYGTAGPAVTRIAMTKAPDT